MIQSDNKIDLPPIKIITAFKKELLETALKVAKGSKTKAAKLLGMNKSSFILMHRRLSAPFFKRSFAVGNFEVTITSSEEIPEYLSISLMKEMRKFV